MGRGYTRPFCFLGRRLEGLPSVIIAALLHRHVRLETLLDMLSDSVDMEVIRADRLCLETKKPMSSQQPTSDRDRLREHQLGKELWRITYALAGFMEICKCIRNLRQINFSKDSPHYYPLLVGLICLYARPFTDNNLVGCIPLSLVPKEDRRLHDILMDLRDEVYAHNDPATLIQAGDYAHDIVFRRQESTVMIIPQRFHISSEFLPDHLLRLAETMVSKAKEERARIEELLKPSMPREIGDYRLNIVDVTQELFLPIKDSST
jgi:hypothetical protein